MEGQGWAAQCFSGCLLRGQAVLGWPAQDKAGGGGREARVHSLHKGSVQWDREHKPGDPVPALCQLQQVPESLD